jgi:drug/metabolite transporter superfamily protein YnfA
MTNVALFVLAAVLEIGGCFAFWVWVRRDAAP